MLPDPSFASHSLLRSPFGDPLRVALGALPVPVSTVSASGPWFAPALPPSSHGSIFDSSLSFLRVDHSHSSSSELKGTFLKGTVVRVMLVPYDLFAMQTLSMLCMPWVPFICRRSLVGCLLLDQARVYYSFLMS